MHLAHLGRLGDHFLQSHGPVREITDGLHAIQRNAVVLPLGDRCRGYAEVRRKGSGSPCLRFQPFAEPHMTGSLGRTKRQRQVVSKPAEPSIGGVMDEDRRRRFVDWYNKKYPPGTDGRKKFMKDCGLTKGRVSQFFDPEQSFGELAASNLAKRLKLPPDQFLKDDEVAPPPAPPDFARTLQVTPEEWALLQDVITAATEDEIAQIRQRAKLINERARLVVDRMRKAEGKPPLREQLLNPETKAKKAKR